MSFTLTRDIFSISKKLKTSICIILLLIPLTPFANGYDKSITYQHKSPSKINNLTIPDNESVQIHPKDKTFLSNAISVGVMEIVASEIAISKAQSHRVMAYADSVAKTHIQLNQQLYKLAEDLGVFVSQDQLIRDHHFKLLNEIDRTKKSQFDSTYVSKIGVSAQREIINLFKHASQYSKDPKIINFVKHNLPNLEKQIEFAQKMEDKIC